MTVKFQYITEDPFTNNTDMFYFVVMFNNRPIPDPSVPGTGSNTSGTITDPNGTIVSDAWITFYQDYSVTGSLSDESYAHSWTYDAPIVLIPPGFSISNFYRAIALAGTLEELAPFMGGRR